MGDTQMQIYTVEWDNDDVMYDTYSEFVVCCKDANEARRTHPACWTYDPETLEWYQLSTDGVRHVDRYHNKRSSDAGASWINAAKIADLIVVHIGTALPGTQKGVIMSSFHAG